MYYNSFALAVAALSTTTTAQTFSKCDPTRGDKCAPDPAFGKCNTPQTFDFTTVASGQGWQSDSNFNAWWLADDGVKFNPSLLNIDSSNGAGLVISEQEQAPLMKTKNYLFFGRVDVEMQVAPGQGIITSVVLESDDRDEIDWEWLGGRPNEIQSNFFSKGVNDFTHGKTHGLAFAATEGTHTYSVDWQTDKIDMYVDGALLRTITTTEADNGAKWPQTPAQLKLGTWVGGKTTMPQGTIDWAGGLADFSKAPFTAFYKKVTITDYCNGKSSAKEYAYGDTSGSASSIQITEGDSSSSDSSSSDSSSSTSSSSSAAASATSSSSSDSKNTSGSSAFNSESATATTTASSSSSKATAAGSSGSAAATTTLATSFAGKGTTNSTGGSLSTSSGKVSATGTGGTKASSTSGIATAGAAGPAVPYAVAGVAALGAMLL